MMHITGWYKPACLCCCRLLFLLLIFWVTGCSKDGAPAQIPGRDQSTPGNIPGMGLSTAALTGEEFHFPTTVEITGGIKGDLFIDPAKDYCQKAGCGAFVMLRLNFVNKTGKDTLLVFPGGLTFHSENTEDQNGLLLQGVTIPLGNGASCKTLLYAFCINEHRHGSDVTSTYKFGPVTNAAPVVELLNLLKNKRINLKPDEKPDFMGRVGALQTMVWNITENNGLTELDRSNIAQIEDIQVDHNN